MGTADETFVGVVRSPTINVCAYAMWQSLHSVISGHGIRINGAVQSFFFQSSLAAGISWTTTAAAATAVVVVDNNRMIMTYYY